jgi:hypothetical protein
MTPEQLVMKNDRKALYPSLESELANFISDMEAHNQPLSGDSITAHAKFIATQQRIDPMPKFSTGWLEKFKRRHGFRGYISHGESGSTGFSEEQIITSVEELRCLLDRYEEHDIYNFDETGLFYAQVPTKTISKQLIAGLKNSKKRLTIGVLCNADGSHKPELVIIGNHRRPQCFKKKDGKESIFF